MTKRVHLKELEKILDCLSVHSLANGNMLVEIKYNIDPIEPEATPIGFLTRMRIADEIAELLHEHIGKIRYAKLHKNRRRSHAETNN